MIDSLDGELAERALIPPHFPKRSILVLSMKATADLGHPRARQQWGFNTLLALTSRMAAQ